MGTRADFYVGRGREAEWLGSIAWDGYPEGIDEPILRAQSEADFRIVVSDFLKRDDGTLPDMGWPWPWDDSNTTDYAYAFDAGRVWCCPSGTGWFDPTTKEPDELPKQTVVFPYMGERKQVTLGKRSGLIILGIK